MVADGEGVSGLELIPVRDVAGLRAWLGFWLRLGFRRGFVSAVLIELVLRRDEVRVVGLVECDACLLDGGVELAVDGVAANGSIGDVLAPCEVEVGAGLLRLCLLYTSPSPRD